MTAQLSRERLEEKLLEHIKHGGDSEEETMIRMLLAGLDNKPVAWIVHARQGDMLSSDGDFVANAEGISSIRSTPLYTAPPAPVAVPDGYEIIAEAWRLMDGQNPTTAEWHSAASRYLNAHSRAAMLKGGPVAAATVPDGWKLVPVEPTEEMMLHKSGCQRHAWDDTDCSMRQTRRLVWAHMLAAAPAAPEQEV